MGEESAQRRGNCLRRTVAAMKPEARPYHRQDSRRAKDAAGRTFPKRRWADSVFPRDGFTGLLLDAGKVNTPTTARTSLTQPAANGPEAWAGRALAKPSGLFVAHPSRSKTMSRRRRRWCSHVPCRSKPGRGSKRLTKERSTNLLTITHDRQESAQAV